MDWLDLLIVQGTLRSLLRHHSSKASVLRRSAFFTVQLSHCCLFEGSDSALAVCSQHCLTSTTIWLESIFITPRRQPCPTSCGFLFTPPPAPDIWSPHTCLFWTFRMNGLIWGLLWLPSFPEHNVFRVHLRCNLCQPPFLYRKEHCMDGPCFICPFASLLVDRHSGWSGFACYKPCSFEHWCPFLCGQMFSFLRCMCFGGELLLSMVIQRVTHTHTHTHIYTHTHTHTHTHTMWLQKPQVSNSTEAAPFYIPTSHVWGSTVSNPCQHLLLFVSFPYNHSSGCKGWSHCGFHLHFPSGWSCDSLTILYFHWIHSGPLSVFLKSVTNSFLCIIKL